MTSSNSFLRLVGLTLACWIGVATASAESKAFDELKFTQLWGYSSCFEFKEQTHNQVECRYEDKPSIWSIHGIWPTQSGTSGPNFCTNVTFHEADIDPVRPQLELYWYEINSKKNPTEFWTHEWVKHGSCAVQLQELNTEYKYFDNALLLRNKFDLYSILKDGGIIPQLSLEGYKLSEFASVFKAALGVEPYLQCYELKERGKPEYHLLAVEICLNRHLNLVSCSPNSRHFELGGVMPCPSDSTGHLVQYTDKFSKARQEEL